MQGQEERWMTLCKQAAVEQDPQKLIQLVKEIDELLEAKQKRLGLKPLTGTANDGQPRS